MPRTLTLLLALAAAGAAAAQGKLDAVRDAVDKPRTDSPSSDDSTSDENPFAALFGGITGNPFESKVKFSEYPYARPGNLYLIPEGRGPRSPAERQSRRAVISTGSTGSGCGCSWIPTRGSG
jgi:hypothetical protein